MRRTTWLVMVGAALAMLAGQASFAQAAGTATAAKPANSQQEKMKTCNADATAKGLKGAERKSYMKSCNAEATAQGLKGDARKSFMKTCLKGSGSAAAK